MGHRSRVSSPSSTVGSVAPLWLEARLRAPDLRILDVRTDEAPSDASGTRLRAAGNVELRGFAHLGAAAGWKTSRERHRERRGLPAVFLEGHVPGSITFDVRAALFDDT